VGVSGELASELVDAGITSGRIAPIVPLVTTAALDHGLRILVADHQVLCLTRELEEASRRISDLVQSIKSYSYMDQSPVAEVAVEEGIDVTLRMFQHQLKHGVQVSREFAKDFPRVQANGSALNQIWTNLIDNALDAMESLPPGQPKRLSVRTCVEPGGILVEIGDNGPGIPPEVQSRIFDPFFTTKPVGEGTGLGLDIVQRIVRNHKGSIQVESEPGRTVFQVRLPR
jgi:signal transduction histidine kinase